MNVSNPSLKEQLAEMRQLFQEAKPTNQKIINEYAWLMVKILNSQTPELGSIQCRQLLADYLQLPTEKPSNLHSAILSCATRVSLTYPEFHFTAFLQMWKLDNLRPEDNERQKAQDGKTFPSLKEKTVKALGLSLITHSRDLTLLNDESSKELATLLKSSGYSIMQMIVTRVKEAIGKDGKKYHFVTLTSSDGIEAETISHTLQPSPLHPLPTGKRHYANIGQLYNVLLRKKQENNELTVSAAYLSDTNIQDVFETETGYIENIDTQHSHIHIYDYHSRHFVAHIERFKNYNIGEFVRIIPIIPQNSKFKTAIILNTLPESSDEVKALVREARVYAIDKKKGYATYALDDSANPLVEKLSPLQLSQGEQPQMFRYGYISLSSPLLTAPLAIGDTFRAFIHLKRSQYGGKSPHVAKIFK